jgi:hypothetical protein
MRKEKRQTTTVTVRLTDEEYEVLRRLCALKRMNQTGYLTHLATSQAKKELLEYAVEEYQAGRASLSELAKKTGLDVPTIMEGVAKVMKQDKQIVEGFLAAVKVLSEEKGDPELYKSAVRAIG